MQHWRDPGGAWEWASEYPRRELRPGVQRYRGYRMNLGAPRSRLEVPAGVVTLVLGFEQQLRLTDVGGAGTGGRGGTAYTSMLAGMQTRAAIGEHTGRVHGVEIVLAPWAAFTLLGVGVNELAETIVHPGDLLGRRVDDLTDALATLPHWEQRFALLDSVLSQWSSAGPPCSARVVWAWQQLCRTGGRVPIKSLAADSGWSWRHFEQRFQEQIGLSPKAAARVLRLRRVLRLLRRGRGASTVATQCGFADQAHLTREVKAMTGSPPGRLMAARRANPAGVPVLDRVAGGITSIRLSG